MKKLYLALLTLALVPAASFASVRVYNQSGTNIGTFTDVQSGNGLTVSQVSGKAKFVVNNVGNVQTQSSASGDLTAAMCGETFTSDNTTVGSPDLFTLPSISSSLLGCRYTFIVGVANGTSSLWVRPQTSEKILLLTATAGHAITADAVGESVVLEALQPGWAPVGKEQGTWTDTN